MGKMLQKSFYDLTPPELESFFVAIGEKKFRAHQVLDFLYRHRVNSIDEMTSLPKDLRARLSKSVQEAPLTLRTTVESPDGTIKHAYEPALNAGADSPFLESVWMPSEPADLSGGAKTSREEGSQRQSRSTLCISAQLGCAAGCTFCATGRLGLHRQLTTGEIVYQVIHASKLYGKLPDTVLFMGMGEPMHNYEAVVSAVNILTHKDGLAMSGRRIVVSTAGELERLGAFRSKFPKVRIAISLNAATDELRSSIMPVNKTFKLRNIAAFISTLKLSAGEKVTLEYVLLGDLNDTVAQERALIRFLKPLSLRVKVNLIPYNPVPGLEYKSPEESRALAMQESLKQLGIMTFIRRNRGRGVSAACGQLGGRL